MTQIVNNVHISEGSFLLPPSFGAVPAEFDVDAVISQIQDNVLADLEATRAALESAGRKVIDDVRDAANTPGTALLRGVESEISYDNVVQLINAYKRGIARRRVALEQ